MNEPDDGLDALLFEPFRRLLADRCPPEVVRAAEAGGSAAGLWDALDQAGFADALRAEQDGGAGLSLAQAAPMIEACGSCALPVPLAFTMAVRAALGGGGVVGPITIAPMPVVQDGGRSSCTGVPFAATAAWIVASCGGEWALWPAAEGVVAPDGIPGSLCAGVVWAQPPSGRVALPAWDWVAVAAVVNALTMAGGMRRVLEMSIAHANERTQFGRPIGKFQAIQQQVSVLAERTFAAQMAARVGCPRAGVVPSRAGAAAAKAYVNEAAVEAAAIAHAVHGAIGITAAHDLNLFTRRLHADRRAYGTETFWYRELGREWLSGGASALDFVRRHLSPTEA